MYEQTTSIPHTVYIRANTHSPIQALLVDRMSVNVTFQFDIF